MNFILKYAGTEAASEVMVLKENEGFYFHRFLAADLNQELQTLNVKLVQKGSNAVIYGKREDVVVIKNKITSVLAKITRSTFKLEIPGILASIAKQHLLKAFEKSQVQFQLEEWNISINVEVCHSDAETEKVKNAIAKIQSFVTVTLEFSPSEYDFLKVLNLDDIKVHTQMYKVCNFLRKSIIVTLNFFPLKIHSNYTLLLNTAC